MDETNRKEKTVRHGSVTFSRWNLDQNRLIVSALHPEAGWESMSATEPPFFSPSVAKCKVEVCSAMQFIAL